MGKVFLSHSSKQKFLIEKIADRLGRQTCFYDNYSVEAGMQTLDEILNGLGRTDIFVLFISDESLKSGWVEKEINQARRLVDSSQLKQFFPIIVDSSINHKDSRIPQWLSEEYNLKIIQEPFLIVKKIEQRMHELRIQKSELLQRKEELFVGRNALMEEFENRIDSLSFLKPTVIVASGLNGVGRRTFVKNGLLKTNITRKNYQPIIITLENGQSIEDFIARIKDLESSNINETIVMLKEYTVDEKIALAISLLESMVNNNEILTVVDEGCIIHSDSRVSNWFVKIANSEIFQNNVTICLLSRYKPNYRLMEDIESKVAAFHVPPMPPKDVEKLFNRYAQLLSVDIDRDQADPFLRVLNGIPMQIFYCVEKIKVLGSGLASNRDHIDEIISFGDRRIFNIVEDIRSKDNRIEILTLICLFEFISYTFLYKIIGRTQEHENILYDFYLKGVFETIGGSGEYIKPNIALTKYMRRSAFKLNQQYHNKLRVEIRKYLSEEENEFSDLSGLLYSIQNALVEGIKVPDKYYIPSFLLRSIIELYNRGKYEKAIELSDKLLENDINFEDQIIGEVKYYLCISLARSKSERFDSEVNFFRDKKQVFFYLKGFKHRLKKEYVKAESYYRDALGYGRHSKAERELVLVLRGQDKYSEATEIARDNYNRYKNNPYHIEAYFTCLIKKINKSNEENQMIEYLLQSAESTHSSTAHHFHRVMRGEYEYYVKKDYNKAVFILKSLLQENDSKFYPVKALASIYKRAGKEILADELYSKYANIAPLD